MKTLELPLVAIKKEAGDAKTFKFGLNEEFSFKPGQYINMTLDLAGDPRGNTRSFSIASSPTEKGFILITTRISASPFKQKFDSLPIGARVKIRGPMGNFILDEGRNAVLLSGGIGITPLRDMIKYATDRKLEVKIVLLYSSRTPEGIIFKDDLEQMKKLNPSLEIINTISDDAPGWKGRRGRIDANLVKEVMPESPVFYICGPPAMVEAMEGILKEMDIDEGSIKTEEFVGY